MSEDESLLVDDYIMYMLEKIREARLEFGAYMEELSGIKTEMPEHGVPLLYQGADYMGGQKDMPEVYEMIAEVFFLEIDMIRHLQRLLSMRDVVPLRQLEWHLELNREDLDQIMTQTPDLQLGRFESAADVFPDNYVEGDDATIAFGYTAALLVEALYWPQRMIRQS